MKITATNEELQIIESDYQESIKEKFDAAMVPMNIAKQLITYLKTPQFSNYGTVCCVLVPCEEGLVLIRRGKKGDEGYGQLALPGGFQEGDKKEGQTLQEVAVRELEEETGLQYEPSQLRLVNAVTDEYHHNVIFFESPKIDKPFADCEWAFDPNEILEVCLIQEPVETAFPFHTTEVCNFFARKRNAEKIAR